MKIAVRASTSMLAGIKTLHDSFHNRRKQPHSQSDAFHVSGMPDSSAGDK